MNKWTPISSTPISYDFSSNNLRVLQDGFDHENPIMWVVLCGTVPHCWYNTQWHLTTSFYPAVGQTHQMTLPFQCGMLQLVLCLKTKDRYTNRLTFLCFEGQSWFSWIISQVWSSSSNNSSTYFVETIRVSTEPSLYVRVSPHHYPPMPFVLTLNISRIRIIARDSVVYFALAFCTFPNINTIFELIIF